MLTQTDTPPIRIWTMVLVAALVLATPATATTGSGCFRVVNVADWDVLNIRALTSARAVVVGTIPPYDHGIIAQEGRCLPLAQPLPSRWCQISYYDDDRAVYGFVKRRYLAPSDCP